MEIPREIPVQYQDNCALCAYPLAGHPEDDEDRPCGFFVGHVEVEKNKVHWVCEESMRPESKLTHIVHLACFKNQLTNAIRHWHAQCATCREIILFDVELMGKVIGFLQTEAPPEVKLKWFGEGDFIKIPGMLNRGEYACIKFSKGVKKITSIFLKCATAAVLVGVYAGIFFKFGIPLARYLEQDIASGNDFLAKMAFIIILFTHKFFFDLGCIFYPLISAKISNISDAMETKALRVSHAVTVLLAQNERFKKILEVHQFKAKPTV